ncbi:hypothetical protein [uncultured Propionibacterium sp.]|uniref:hypothetical protein n=1 Tax=uncultured Propionibacterium sp. TaxID=218066 RepID=UPI002930B15B|nr:hypothetical protein [uncultured Propionibacterium sp.]
MDVSEELLALADATLPEAASLNAVVQGDLADYDDEAVAYDALGMMMDAHVTIPEDLLLRALDEYSDSWTFVELATKALERQRQTAA